MNSERVPILASFVLSLVLNASIFLSVNQSMDPQARLNHSKESPRMNAFQKARKIEIEFVEAPPQKPIRKPEHTNKIAARDSLAQDLGKLKSNAMLSPATAKLGPSDQLAQRQLRDMPTQPKPSVSKKEPLALPGDPKSWFPSTQKSEQDQAQEEALDKITTMEMAVKRSSGAPFQGVTSFEATGSGMGAYMKNLKDRIWLEWFPYIAFRYPMSFETADAVVRFTIGRRGEIKTVEVIDYRGSPLFATFCMQVIRRAGAFGALPPDLLAMMGKDELEIKFAFHYR